MTEEVKIVEDERTCETCQIREDGEAIAQKRDAYAAIRYRTPFCVQCAINPSASQAHGIMKSFGLDPKALGFDNDNWRPIVTRAEDLNIEELVSK